MIPYPIRKLPTKEKFYLSCILASISHFVPGSRVEYLQDNEIVARLTESGEKRYHIFCFVLGRRRTVKLVSVNVPQDFTLDLLRTVSTLTGGGYPFLSVEREDSAYLPSLATGFARMDEIC